jgi:predicted XRE-type DNA-binding protein
MLAKSLKPVEWVGRSRKDMKAMPEDVQDTFGFGIMKEEIEIYHGSGNVFADLGLPDAEERLAKAELARRIFNIIVKRRLTQAQAADLLGIDQPKVSALTRGKLSGFSMERLFHFLNALGSDVQITIKAKPRSRQLAHLKVT